MSDDTDDMKHKDGRYHPEVEKGLRQFLKIETGLGNSRKFRRGHEFTFSFTDEQKARVNRLMAEGQSFDDAFDFVKATPWALP